MREVAVRGRYLLSCCRSGSPVRHCRTPNNPGLLLHHPEPGLSSRRTVSSTSVTCITPGADCSTATVSTTGVTGCFTFRAAFLTGAALGLALATVGFAAFAALAALRALPRLAELRSFARFCTFDAFLRLAMSSPLVLRHKRELSTDRSLSATALALFFLGRTARPRTRTR